MRRVPMRRVRSALTALREQLPVGRPLSAVHISAVGDRVLVRDEDAVWEPDSGQLALDFSVAEVVERAEPIARRSMEGDVTMEASADDWYDRALDLEAVDVESARRAYEQALTADPDHSDAHVNLGQAPARGGAARQRPREHYRAAASADPGSGRSRYTPRRRAGGSSTVPTLAIDEYRAAITADESLAAAHFNLARLLEAGGREAEALSHLAAYKRLLGAQEVGS